MTLHHPIGRAHPGPTDHRHIPQTLDRITGISAAICPRPPRTVGVPLSAGRSKSGVSLCCVTWDECLAALEARTDMYVSFPYYPSTVGLLVGFDLAQPQPVLRRFSEWMSARHGGSSLWFASLALIEHTGRDDADEYARFRDVEPDEQVRAVRHLCGLLRDFLSANGDEPPPCPVALVQGDETRVQHGQPGADAPSLCGIPAERLSTYRHLFYGDRESDCGVCAERVWSLPRRG